MEPRRIAVAALALSVLFWVAVVVAGSSNPNYSQSRDYISALASVGAGRPWLGMFAIAAVGASFVLLWPLVRPFSRTAAIAVALAGVLYVFAALARIRCVEGAAFCGIGDRRNIDLENTRGYIHEAAVVSATLAIIVSMAAFGIALLRARHTVGGVVSLAAAVATVLTFALTNGDSPGTMQRIWVGVMMLWVAGVAAWTLIRAHDPSASVAA